MVGDRRPQKLAGHEYIDSANLLGPTIPGNIRVRVSVPGHEKVRLVLHENRGRLKFLTGRYRFRAWRNMMKHKPSISALVPNGGAAGTYSCRGIHVTIKQLVQKDDELSRVGIADDSRNALGW
jgi:hypothetical protein